MDISRMTLSDAVRYKAMETGIDSDYVLDNIEYLIKKNKMYKAEGIDGKIIAICKLEKLVEGFGFLGSARTSIHHRGKGIQTALTAYVIDEAKRDKLKWVGLTTDEVNYPVHGVMNKLGFELMGRSVACIVKNDISPGQVEPYDREVINSPIEKRRLLKDNLDRHHRSFYYLSPYYALPNNEDTISETYIEQLKVVRVGEEHYFIVDTNWGDGYKTRQMHYYGGNVLNHPKILYDFLSHYVEGGFAEIWIEILDARENEINYEIFENVREWRLYGMNL